MPRIKIDPNRVNDLSTKERNIKNKTSECQAAIGTVINNLDWKVSSRASINTRLNNVRKRLQKQTQLMDSYVRVLGTINDSFGNKDCKLKQDARNLLYQMNSISAALAIVGKATPKSNYKTDDKLRKLFSINDVFGISGGTSHVSLALLLNMKQSGILTESWGTSKDVRSLLGGIDDISDLTSVFFDKDTVEKYLGWAGDLKKTKVFESIGYIKDAEKLINSIKDNDIEKIGELGEKYLKKGAKSIAKTTYGTGGFAAAGYINLGWNFFENILDVDKFSSVTSSNSDIVGLGKYIWHCTGGVMLETGSEMAYDIVKDVGSLFNYDLDKVYKDLTGEGGVEGFYKGFSMAVDGLFGDYYNGTKSSGVLEGTATLVGDSLGWWGNEIGKVAENVGNAAASVGEKVSEGIDSIGDTLFGWIK